MQTRLNDPKTGAFVVIMQRSRENDLTGHILEKEIGDWVHLCLPMRYDSSRHCSTVIGWEDPRTEEGELLCPDRFGEEEVRLLEQSLGPFGTSGQLQQSPEPRGGGIFKRDWWELWPPQGEEFTEDGKPLKPLEYPPMEYIVASLDTALTTKEENDWSALTIWGVWIDYNDSTKTDPRKMMLMDAWRGRLEFHQLVEKVINLCNRRRVDTLLIEAKAQGISVGQEIRRLCTGNEFGIRLENPQGDKVARAYSVQHLFSAGLVYAPDRKWVEMVRDEMSAFPKATHDDLTDSATSALRYLRQIGLAKTRAESADDYVAERQLRGEPEDLYPI